MSLLAVSATVFLTVAIAAVTSQSVLLLQQIKMLRMLVEKRDREIQRLTNLLCSKDPMTYATIQQTIPSISASEPYISTGTDEAEAKHWAQLMNQPVEDDDQNYSEDLEEMGLRS